MMLQIMVKMMVMKVMLVKPMVKMIVNDGG